ncbi:hypothetical protein GXP67_33930 [Rhodocytophaga rosea]|uniref:Uncharacterized protein n=1 Tax=Rhodocytophaga rosea TaxID=2704465 RepID=A0A6C0GVF2_9BACT|nr:hypothetical protein [Rhodocytophaga rosea]QHT71302.1 hypothetical protein GXP67_33930 [Rhodocytophaga rosea]
MILIIGKQCIQATFEWTKSGFQRYSMQASPEENSQFNPSDHEHNV